MEAHILRRPFGVYAADAEAGTVDMMYQVLGFGTEHMTELAVGDAVEMIGPIGRGWQPPEGCKRALIVAGGVGSAPLYPLAEELTAAGVATDAILGASTIDALVARERYGAVLGCEPAWLHRRRHLRPRRLLHAACGRGPGGGRCGRRALRLRGLLRPGAPHEDRGRHGGCGRRVLRGVHGEAHGLRRGGLSVLRGRYDGPGKRRACVDGPVFCASEVVW